jgi:hypothetical protein
MLFWFKLRLTGSRMYQGPHKLGRLSCIYTGCVEQASSAVMKEREAIMHLPVL